MNCGYMNPLRNSAEGPHLYKRICRSASVLVSHHIPSYSMTIVLSAYATHSLLFACVALNQPQKP